MRRLGLVLSGCVLAAFVGTAVAQSQEHVYTQVGLWDVPRAKWADFVAYFEKYEKPMMEEMLNRGVVIEWGLESAGLHDPEGYSHASWFSARSQGDLEKVLDAFYETDSSGAADAELAKLVTKHRDMVVRSHFYGSRPAKLSKAYLLGTSVRVRRGKGADFRKSWEAWAKPIYEKLLADGTIVSYTLETAYYHTDEDSLGRHWDWCVVENMDNEQKVVAAFEAADEKMSEVQREAMDSHYWDLIIEGSHRDDFGRLIHYQTK